MSELIISAADENLDSVLEFVTEHMEAHDCEMKQIMQVCVAVEEIFVNIAHYAYNPEVGGVTIRISMDSDITIEFEDHGKPYNPLEKDDPDVNVAAEERDIGGLGIFMVKKIMDAVEYKYENNKNILTISKALIS